MILADTSVWIKHLRVGEPLLAKRLADGDILIHPLITGELACGNIKNRSRFLRDLRCLPSSASATDEEALQLVETRKLWGRGLGWIDVHLLASAIMSNSRLWTLDIRLKETASDLKVAF